MIDIVSINKTYKDTLKGLRKDKDNKTRQSVRAMICLYVLKDTFVTEC